MSRYIAKSLANSGDVDHLNESMYVLLVDMQQSKHEARLRMDKRLARAVIVEVEILGAILREHEIEVLVNHECRRYSSVRGRGA